MSIDVSAECGTFFVTLIRGAAEQAEAILVRPGQEVRLRAIRDDGFSELARLELSPLPEDQYLAVALRLSRDGDRKSAIFAALADQFRSPPLSIAVEAQRKLVESRSSRSALSLKAATEAVDAIKINLSSAGVDYSRALRLRAAFYSDFWCDPRIAAAPGTRRVMLTMSEILKAQVNVEHANRLPTWKRTSVTRSVCE